MEPVQLSYAVPKRRRAAEHGSAVCSILCAMVPVTGMVLQNGPLLATGMLAMLPGLLLGLYGAFAERSVVLGVIGSTLNGMGVACVGWFVLAGGMC